MGIGRMCCLLLGLCYLSQSGYLLDEEGNDGFSEFLFEVIVDNGCSQKSLSVCHFLHYQPRFAGLRMVTLPWSVSV